MLGVSGLISSSGDGASPAKAPESGGGSSNVGGGVRAVPFSEEDGVRVEEGGGQRNSGGNRWPRQETLSLLRIRSDMDAAFRDSSHKAPLWEEVSRKMAELGYRRSSKKCKEKFENLYKYHKRTKDGRPSKSNGKSYRFFDQLEAFENNTTSHSLTLPPRPPPPLTTLVAPPLPGNIFDTNNTSTTVVNPPVPVAAGQGAVSSTQSPLGASNPINSSPFPPPSQPLPATPAPATTANVSPFHRNNSFASCLRGSTSSSTSSDEDIQRRHRRKRKRKYFFKRLMRDVIEKQEQMQKKFLETIEKREIERMAREEAWRAQEMARMNREHDLLLQERSMAAAKDVAVIKFLQNLAEQHNIQIPTTPIAAETQPPPPQQLPPQAPQPISIAPPATDSNKKLLGDNFVTSITSMSASRWPKTEIEALIRIRTSMDTKYQENGPKGPLWEEVSAEMQKLGYNRSAKRCKEKWENINKYFKKVKESSKKRPEDSKTCPYFHQLDELYKEKAKNEASFNQLQPGNSPIMAQPEQQWPLPAGHSDQDDNEEDDTDDDNDEGGGYEVLPTPGTAAATAIATSTAE